MSAVPTITSEPQLDAKIAAELQGPHVGMDMAPSEPQLPAEPVQGGAAPPANTRKIGLTVWFAAYTSIFICMSTFVGCMLAILFALRAITVTLVGFVLVTGYDYFTVGLPGFFVLNDSYLVHWQTAALGAGLIGFVCGPVVTLAMGGVAFVKRARGKLDEASKSEHMKMKRNFHSVVKAGCSFVFFDVALGALMYPVGSFASERYLWSEENLFMAAPARCIAIGVLGGVVPRVISIMWKLVKGKKGGEIQLPADDSAKDSEKDSEKQPLPIV
ncbi:hypothetical protein EW026_g8387 [Hermanssonia centrifuga]|uniref:Uncharacterized protein n=1 Tax=Hermanssonia centrifuga TaxID=98765 RepID=A0A4S4K605_9APHY|nr:hypothetical protein EW026_g8387 [Hermanssonia centrifuga]